MKIGIDAREIEGGVHTGIGRALAVFLDFFARQDDANEAVLFSTKPLPLDFSKRISCRVSPQRGRFLWDQAVLPLLIMKERIDLFYSPYYKVPVFCSCPRVGTIYDLTYVTFEAYRKSMSPFTSLYYKTIGQSIVNSTTQIVTSSEFSKTEIMRFYSVPAEKISVIPLGIARSCAPIQDQRMLAALHEKFSIKKDFVLYAGNFRPHKNVSTLIDAFAIARKAFPVLLLVLAGQKETGFTLVEMQVASRGLSDAVICTGALNDAELLGLYSSASVFVMPSLSEGFGYPPVEAMACGAPVIASNTSSLPEVVGNAGMLVDPRDSHKMAAAIIEVLQSPALRATLITAGKKRAIELSADRYAGELYNLFKRIIGDFYG